VFRDALARKAVQRRGLAGVEARVVLTGDRRIQSPYVDN
jgi:hypothetical protein